MPIQIVKLVAEPQFKAISSPTALEGGSYTGAVGELLSVLDEEQAALLVQVQTALKVDCYGVSVLEGICQVPVCTAEESRATVACIDVMPDLILSHYLN